MYAAMPLKFRDLDGSTPSERVYEPENCLTCGMKLSNVYLSKTQTDGQRVCACQGKTCIKCNYPIFISIPPPSTGQIVQALRPLMPMLLVMAVITLFLLSVALVRSLR